MLEGASGCLEQILNVVQAEDEWFLVIEDIWISWAVNLWPVISYEFKSYDLSFLGHGITAI